MSNGKIQKKDIMVWIREGRAVPEPVRYVPPEKTA